MTKGIDIWQLPISINDTEVQLNIWDLGGQGIMHATHQFFLTRRSLYLLILDARKGEQESNVEYWLRLIQSFGEDSPIIVVTNKVDIRPLDINRRGLREKYPSIKAFVGTSCKDSTGFEELRNVIAREIDQFPHIHTPWLRNWFTVKRRLEKMEQDYISYDTYCDMCIDANITDEKDQRTLIRFLHDLGVVLNYCDDPRLEETNILNPEWITIAVYKILTSHILFHSKGVLERAQLANILDSKQYASHKHNFIIGVMQKFELCFPLNENNGASYLVPDLLSREEPYVNWPEPEDCLLFQYQYQALPSSVISRFIVRMHTYTVKNAYWRTGTVLAYQGNRALISADLEERRVTISVIGNEGTRREFLAIIRSNFDHIHRTIPRIEAIPQVPIPDRPDIVIDYRHLLILEQLGQETFVPPGLSDWVYVKNLLDGVDARSTEPVQTIPPDQIQLRNILFNRFDESELQNICFDLDVDYYSLPGEGKMNKARELVAYMRRRERLHELVKVIKRTRPDISWKDTY